MDMNGDCLSDLFIATESRIEVWLNTKGDFKLDKVLSLVPGAGQPTFADFGIYIPPNVIELVYGPSRITCYLCM